MNKEKEYEYFISFQKKILSYYYINNHAVCLNKKIQSIEDIRTIEEFFIHEENWHGCVILNYKLMNERNIDEKNERKGVKLKRDLTKIKI